MNTLYYLDHTVNLSLDKQTCPIKNRHSILNFIWCTSFKYSLFNGLAHMLCMRLKGGFTLSIILSPFPVEGHWSLGERQGM